MWTPGPTTKSGVKVMWNTLDKVVNDLDAAASKEDKLKIKKFLLHVRLARRGETQRARKQQPTGPGRSFFQFEPGRAKDAVDYADQKKWLDKLATASGLTADELKKAANELQLGKPWPDKNPIEKHLVTNDLFGHLHGPHRLQENPRCHSRRQQEPGRVLGQALEGGVRLRRGEEELIERFTMEAKAVDELIP